MGLILRQRYKLLTLLLVLFATNLFATTKRDNNYLFARIGVAMASSIPVRQADNTYNINYTVTLKNYGNETITGLQVTHIYSVEYVLSAVRLVGNVTATGSLVGNNFFANGLDFGLLKTTSKLYAGEKQTIVYTLNVDPNIVGFGPFLSFVTASGFGDLAIPVLDLSVAGLDPDPNGDGSPAETSLTSTTFSPFPVIGVAKSASAPVTLADGTANVTYTVTVKNLGNEALKEVQVTDQLDALLNIIAPATFTVVSKPISSGTLTGNNSFNGSSNINLLAAGGTLASGQQQTITFTVNIDPNGPSNGAGFFGPYSNSVTATAKGNGSNTPTIDTSVNGNNVDPNGDGLPLEASVTPVSLIPLPVIGIAKSASSPLAQPDGSYNITYKITLENLGNVQLTNVQVTDILSSAFPAPTQYAVVSATVASGTLIAKVGYDGNATNNLLATGSTLNVGATQTITFTVNVKPNGLFGPFVNTAAVSALGGVIPVADVSVDGNDPDPNGDGLPLETSPTLSLLTPVPLIGISKSASPPIKQQDGSYNITFKMTVENLGNENLTNVRITDALASVFIAPNTYSLVGNVVTSGTLVADATFNGNANINLLAGGSTLAVGATQTVQFTINVKGIGVFLNTAIASAEGSLLPTVDISVDGDDPDPNGDGLPLETLPTTVTLLPIPVIGVSKSASTPALQANGSYNITFSIKVENLGNEALDNVQVTDALASVFIAPSVYSIVGNVLTSGTLAANAGFNGGLVTELLAPGSKLAIGETQTITFTVNVQPNTLFGPFINQAVATASGNSSGLLTTDLSVDGNDPDPNGDNLPLEVLPTIVNMVPFPLIGVSKSASTPILQADGSYLVTFTVALENLGNEDLQNVQVTDALVSVFGTGVYSLVGGVIANGSLVANAGFNGNLVTNLLAPGSTLAVGATQKINFTVQLKPTTFFGPFLNQAIATATGSLLPTTDISVDGNDPDPNGDGLPLEASPTSLLLIPAPIIGLAKSATSPLLQPDGSYNITYQFTLKNLGNVKLENVQITDVMASVFNIPGESSYSILGSTVSSGTLIANPTFDGNLQTNLLNAGSTLEVGATQTVQVTINAKPVIFFGPFINTAVATASGGLLPTMDLSVDGNNPDPNGDGIPLETWPTVVTLIPNPVIGISKNISSTILQADGSYNVTYDIHLKNYGNVPLSNVFVTDNLSSIFGLSAGVSLTAAVSTTGGLKANLGFNGGLDINLLDGAQSNLPIGGSETITYTVNVKPGGVFGPYCNSAIATATGPLGVGLTVDISHIGTDPDPNGNGKPNEAGENDCTPITLTPNPIIGIAKAASSPALQPGGTYNVTFTLTVKNMGNIALTDITVVDDLTTIFPAGVTFVPVGAISTTGTLLANANFDGNTDKGLLATGSTLAIGASGTIVFTLNVTPNGKFGPFYNTAVAAGKAGAQITSDISTSGSNPDPNNNGNPGDPGESSSTSFSFTPNPVVGIAKASSSPLLQQSDGSYNVSITFTVQNLGNVDLENVQLTDNLASVFPAPGVTYSIVGAISSPGTLLPNTSFNGDTDVNILAAGSTLGVGATEHLTLNLNIKPVTSFGPFFNSATATAKAVGSAATTSDVSTDGNKPDPNNNGNPGDPGENTSTSISLTPHPVIGVAKSSGAPVLLSNGSYNVPFTITVANLGNVGLQNVQVTDNIASVVGSPATYTIPGAIGVTGGLVANTSFNGNSDINLLAAGSTLAVGATSTISFTVNIVPNTYFGPFSNSATGTANGVAMGISTTDISVNGSNPDPNGNGNPGDPGENSSTTVTLTPNPAFGTSLNASVPQLQADGSYRVVLTIYIKNLGNVPFTDLQTNLDLKSAIGTPAAFTLISPPSTSGSLSVNTAYDGSADTKLLATAQTLALGATETITIPVAIKPNGNFGPFGLSASSAAKAAAGVNYSDLSAPGTNPDPNGNGNPGDAGENDPTPVTLTPHPVLGVAQTATALLQPGGKYKINFVVTVRNMGNVDLSTVQVTNNLATTFADAASFAMIGSVNATGGLIANTSFNGNGNNNLLSGGALPIGSVQLISFSVLVDGGGYLGPYFSNAYGAGTGNGFIYNDISTAGTNVDPNGNGNPGDPNEDIPTVINLAPSVVAGLAKAVSFIQIQSDGSYRVTYTFTVKNLGNSPITNLRVIDHLSSTFPAPATFTIANGPFTTGQLVANPNFNGKDNFDLLATGSKLGVGANSTITLAVDVKLNGGSGTFYNTATLAAIDDDLGLTYADISAPGGDPDPNGNGDPGDPGENSPTEVTLSPKAIIGVAKTVSNPRKQADGSFNFTYHITIRNMGNVLLSNVQVEDDLRASFPSPATFTVTEIKSETGLTVNSQYGAVGNKNLLSGSANTLAPGAIGTIDYSINLNPASSEGPFFNSARATAMGSGGTGFTSDVSAPGTNPDPNGNGNPGDPGEDDATSLSLALTPVIGVAKAVAPPRLQPNNSYNVTYTLTLKNLGDLPLYNVGLYDNVAFAFPSPANYTIPNSPTSTGSLVIDNNYNGDTQFNLLAPSSTLAVGATETVTLTLNVSAPPTDQIYYNSAIASASSQDGTMTYTDISTTGIDPDPNANGNPNDVNENIPTAVVLKLVPVLGLANSASTPVLKEDGTYDIEILVTIDNLGNEKIDDIEVINNLVNTFPEPIVFSVISAPVPNGNVTTNPNYNGKDDIDLVTGGILEYGEKATVKFKINVVPHNTFGVFWNNSWGTGIGGTTAERTSDTSEDGIDPDPNRTGQPDQFRLNTASRIELDPKEVVGVATMVSSIAQYNNCTYDVTLVVNVENFGNSNLDNVSITDDLSSITASGATYTIESVVASNSFVTNPQFNGGTDKELLSPGNTLLPLETATITIIVRIEPNQNYGPYESDVDATAYGPQTTVLDESMNNERPDPDGNKVPDEKESTPIKIDPVGLKIPEGFSPNGDGDNDMFVVTLECGITAKVTIYNRWGDKVYHNNNYNNDWDGVSNDGSFLGKPLPDGTYFYMVELSSGDKISSFITLKR